MKYGFPYMGSKSKICESIISILPDADNFYDLFAGGGAITHCAMLSRKYKNIYSNDIQNTMQLFVDAINGKYKDEKRWISREKFFKEKNQDPYVRWIWSFGNNGEAYLFGKKTEETKRLAHEYLFVNGYDYTAQSRIRLIKQFKEIYRKEGRFELQQLEQLQRLQRLQQLERLERLQQLEISAKDYLDVVILPNSVVYCDIPYNQKQESKEKYYGISFNSSKFYEWALKSDFAVYFSSVFIPDEFEIVLEKHKECLMNNKNSHGNKKITERLAWNKKGFPPLYKKHIQKEQDFFNDIV